MNRADCKHKIGSKKTSIIFTVAFRIMGIIVLLIGIRMIIEGVLNYVEEHKQTDWILTTAEVTDISSRVTSSSRKHHSDTVFDITYQYEVNGNAYSDVLYNRSRALMIGDRIKIKYDPEKPEKSTDILSPSFGNLILFLAFGVVLTTIGFFLSGAYALICLIRRRGKPKEEEYIPPEEYVESKDIKNVRKNSAFAIAFRIVFVVIIIGGNFLLLKLFPRNQTMSAEQFQKIAETDGYTTADTSDELRQSWKVGSMLEKSVSFNDGNVRMDFCIMDTVDSASLLYNGMTLPLSEGKKQDYDGTAHELYSIENDSLYVAKIRIRDTVMYVSAQAEYKARAVELLKKFGYWKE